MTQAKLNDMNIDALKVKCLAAINDNDTKAATRIFKEYIELIVFNLLLTDHSLVHLSFICNVKFNMI